MMMEWIPKRAFLDLANSNAGTSLMARSPKPEWTPQITGSAYVLSPQAFANPRASAHRL